MSASNRFRITVRPEISHPPMLETYLPASLLRHKPLEHEWSRH
jgi:hypothetical protein